MELIETPIPSCKPGYVLIRTYHSVISKGTEESLLAFGKASWWKKTRLQPDKWDQIKNKVKTDGLVATWNTVRTKLDHPITPGYSQSGIVVEVGSGVSQVSVGDRVISNGPHAEYVLVPENLCQKIPQHCPISLEEAAFTPIASIALQGIRLLGPSLGDTIAVQGLGLIGLITVQLLKAQGCRVLGIDFEGPQLKLARSFGADIHSLSEEPNPVSHGLDFSRGNGVDGVIITASTQSSEPIHHAAQMSRKRGKIILVGTTGTQIQRSDFYAKELSFQVSCSYGPGRYDVNYEEKGLDYPIAYARWTEKRNMEAIIDLIQDKKLNLKPLISHRFPLVDAARAYSLLNSTQRSYGIVLSYPIGCLPLLNSRKPTLIRTLPKDGAIGVGMIGAGSHASKILLPCLKKLKIRVHSIASQSGLSATLAARKFKVPQVAKTASEVITDPEINTIFISTQHNSHAELVKECIKLNKHIYVEKPLALSIEEIKAIQVAMESISYSKTLWLGFNRRFSPLSIKLKELFSSSQAPKQMIYTVNALPLPASHWIHDPKIGGGRIISELGHFLDLLCFFADSPVTQYSVHKISHHGIDESNSLSLSFKFQNESIGTLHYATLGHRGFPKERIEIFSEGKVAVLDNFKTLRGFGFSNFSRMSLWSQDKGHLNCLRSFFKSIESQSVNPWLETFFEVSRWVCRIQNPEQEAPLPSTQVA
ncbi:MAG: bi-domain-containing oxidoreductase [Deltaproteobacteria bacterium]